MQPKGNKDIKRHKNVRGSKKLRTHLRLKFLVCSGLGNLQETGPQYLMNWRAQRKAVETELRHILKQTHKQETKGHGAPGEFILLIKLHTISV